MCQNFTEKQIHLGLFVPLAHSRVGIVIDRTKSRLPLILEDLGAARVMIDPNLERWLDVELADPQMKKAQHGGEWPTLQYLQANQHGRIPGADSEFDLVFTPHAGKQLLQAKEIGIADRHVSGEVNTVASGRQTHVLVTFSYYLPQQVRIAFSQMLEKVLAKAVGTITPAQAPSANEGRHLTRTE